MDRISTTTAFGALLAGLFVLLAFSTALANELSVSFRPEPPLRSEFTAVVELELSEPLLGIGARMRYEPTLLEITEVRPAPGTKILWVDRPTLVEGDDVVFAGVFPGGLTPDVEPVVPLVHIRFRVKDPGQARFSFDAVRAYRSEPLAPDAAISAPPVTQPVTQESVREPVVVSDASRPEPFELFMVRDPDIADGDWVLLFDPLDGQSGVAGTDVRERFLGFGGTWRPASSPYRLADQTLLSVIEVRARDEAGHERIEQYVPTRMTIVRQMLIASILVLALIFGLRIWYDMGPLSKRLRKR